MSRKPKTSRVPRTRAGGEWTEASFMGFVRSGVRALSRRWPPLVRLCFEACRRKSQSDNKRLKWEHQCHDCKGWFPRKEVEADHIVPCGSLKTLEDVSGFMERLLCETEGIVVRCERCHQARTNQQREVSNEQ